MKYVNVMKLFEALTRSTLQASISFLITTT